MAVNGANLSVVQRVCARFQRDFGGSPLGIFFAPGRVNLVGAHLDYNGGDVLPMALDRGVYVAARANEHGLVRLRSLDQELVLDVPSASVAERSEPSHGWGAYPIGVWSFFREETGRGQGVDLVYGGDLPLASGLSSSAAIEIATAFALNELHGTGLGEEDLARLGHRAETRFVGLRCGIMDQYASALGRPQTVLLLHCDGPSYEYVPLDPRRCEMLLMDTRKPRPLTGTGFNQRVAECAEAHATLRRVRDLPCLAAYRTSDLEAAAGSLQGVHLMRARHVVSEMERVATGVAALRRGEVAELGASMNGSHRSAAIDYEVSCDELDVITDAAREVEGVHGARMTGAGFGGCAIALMQPGCADRVEREVSRRFTARFGVEPLFDLLSPGSGPGRVE